MIANKQRPISWLDIARIAGAAAVVMIHVCAPVVVAFGAVSMKLWWIGNILDSASRWSVPLFVMISGALLLDPRVLRPLPEFMRKRSARVIVPLAFWTTVYFVWVAWWDHTMVDLHYVIEGVASGIPYSHLYFLFLIFGLYLVTPMLRIYVMHASRANAMYCLLVLFGLSALSQFVGVWLGIGQGLNLASQFVPYVGYYLAGYYFKGMYLPKRSQRLAGLGIVLFIAVTALVSFPLVAHFGLSRGLYMYEYNSITTIGEALLLYIFLDSVLRNVGNRGWVMRRSKLIRLASAAAFGVYLIHPLFLEVLNRYGFNALNRPPYGLLGTYVTALALSFVAILVLQRVPYVRRIVP